MTNPGCDCYDDECRPCYRLAAGIIKAARYGQRDIHVCDRCAAENRFLAGCEVTPLLEEVAS